MTRSPPLSDHLPTLTIHHKHSTAYQKKRPKTLSNSQYQKHKEAILERALKNIKTAREETDENTTNTEHFAIIQEAIREAVEHFERVPRRRKKPWCSLRMRKMISRQHVLHKRALRKPSARNIRIHRAYRRDLNKTIKAARRADLMHKLKRTKGNHRKQKKFPVNYRSITLLPIIAKTLDKLINDQLMTHLTAHNIISPTQYAFRPNSNTVMGVQAVLNRIHRHKQNKHPTLAIYIDLSKAYDTVSHEKLIHKLKHTFNFADSTVASFASYFRNRT